MKAADLTMRAIQVPPRVAVVGALNVDLVVRAQRIPVPGETVVGQTFYTALGGKGANQAVAAARLGARVTMVGRVGDDQFGRMHCREMELLGIRVDFLGAGQGAPTGTALIIVDAQGQNSIVVVPGANGLLAPDDVVSARPAFEFSDAILVQLEIPLPTAQCAIELAHELGVPVILNPAPAPPQPLPAAILRAVDYLIPNEFEATALTGIQVTDLSSAERAALWLQAEGIGTVIVTLGAQGAVAAFPQGTLRVPPFLVKTVDATAAGDAFVGAFSVALSEGQTLADALRFASAAGALATTRLGAQPSLPGRQEVEALLREGPQLLIG